MMANDVLSDCTCAAFYHAIQLWSSLTSTEDTEPDSNVIALYSAVTGYNPADPSTDNGANMQDVLTYLYNTGAPVGIGLRNKIQAFVEIDPTNIQDLQRTIYDSGVAYIGVNLPTSAMSGNSIWDIGGDQTIEGGHCISLVGYDTNAHTFKLISWGQFYTATEAFINKFCEEAYGIVDASWIAGNGDTPLGMTIDELDAIMQGLKVQGY
jgi:hypothetical protein